MSKRMTYQVDLNTEERADLKQMLRRGVHKAREIRRARTLLLLDQDRSRADVAETLDVTSATITTTAKRYCQGGLNDALFDRHRSGAPPKITKRDEARICAIACSKAPDGTSGWTLALIRDEFLMLSELDDLSTESVRRVLKKTNSSPGSRSTG